jgi:hypothetical protein
MGFDTPAATGAPTGAEYVTGSSDADLSNEVVRSPASDILLAGSFGTTTSISPGFGSWTQIDANNPGFVFGHLFAETNGSSNGIVKVQVDESGGTTADYTAARVFADDNLPSAARVQLSYWVYVPGGGQFQIVNVSDPRGTNTISVTRTLTITP